MRGVTNVARDLPVPTSAFEQPQTTTPHVLSSTCLPPRLSSRSAGHDDDGGMHHRPGLGAYLNFAVFGNNDSHGIHHR